MTQHLSRRWRLVKESAEAGMTTAEYAVGTLAACAFAAVLMLVVKSGPVKSALAKVITAALGTGT
ncbi:DUF4244 domain-containing protein [Knoellia subterranea]|uniref:DUF4244 domain-containing protein n=1 Tax=Knoellia subterranea KCTC 19937 TaxID=1385521 RepID=A0A0A0JL12_9MICO|nr:DUF4244 domain-containing protein [Knoellia subterranea]KGN38100.1 hypothetical protein N803_10055 [Knoellia subterranea KCTC 19937]